MIPYCNAHGIGLIPWGPLHAGDLARPVDATSARKEATKGSIYERKLKDVDVAIIGRVKEVAEKKGWTMGQVALAWIDKKVSSPIVGISSVSFPLSWDDASLSPNSGCIVDQVKRLDENILVEKDLTEEEVKFLEEP